MLDPLLYAAAVAQREREHTDALIAAGFRPQAAATLREPEEIRRRSAAIRALQDARPPAPTGVLWSAGQEPSGLVASARGAAARGRRPNARATR
jgi:hypothetical protein